jgi:uncharacterized protein YcfJ
MNKSLLMGLIVGAAASAGAGALANLASRGDDRPPEPVVAAVEQPASQPAPEQPAPVAAPEPAPAPVTVPNKPRIVRAVRTEPEFVRVVSVQPLSRTVSESRQVCNDVEVEKPAPVRDQRQITGSIIGGVLGGVIGNQIGDGDGRKIARVAGAIGGAYAGNKVQERIQASRTVKTTEQRCDTVHEPREVPDGYDVTYEWDGGTRTVRMPNHPGSQLPVRSGEVVLTASAL